MAEQLFNLYFSTLAAPYVAGSGTCTVASATGLPATGTFTLDVIDVANNVVVTLRVASRVGAVLTVSAEGPDHNAASGLRVLGGILSAAALAQIKLDAAAGSTQIVSTVSLTGQAASIGATPLTVNGGMAPAGVYRLNIECQTTNGQTGSGSISVTLAWVPGNGATGAYINSFSLGSPAFIPTTTPTQAGSKVIHHDGSADITYATTYVATGEYDLFVVLERLL